MQSPLVSIHRMFEAGSYSVLSGSSRVKQCPQLLELLDGNVQVCERLPGDNEIIPFRCARGRFGVNTQLLHDANAQDNITGRIGIKDKALKPASMQQVGKNLGKVNKDWTMTSLVSCSFPMAVLTQRDVRPCVKQHLEGSVGCDTLDELGNHDANWLETESGH